MLSNTNIPDLETLLRKDLVDRPVNALFIEHNYTDLELGTLNSLEPDASKAIGRQLSDTERNVLLEYKGNSIASDSRPSAFTVTTAALGGLLSIMFMTEIRHLSLRDLGGIAFVVFQTALLFKPAESQLLSLRILSDPRMSEFKESIQRRKKDFGGHEPEIVRRKDRNIVPPIQWFRDVCWSNYIASIKVSPPSEKDCEERLLITDYPDHPDLSWPEGALSYKKQLEDNVLAKKNRVFEGKLRTTNWQEVSELCDQMEPLSTFVYNPGSLIPRLYVE